MMGGHTPSRRGLLGAIALAPVGITSLSSAASMPADRARWDKALRGYEEAKRKREIMSAVWMRVNEAHRASAPSLQDIDMTAFPYMSRTDVAFAVDVDLRERRFAEAEGIARWAADPGAAMQAYRTSCDSVRRYRAARSDNDWSHDWDEVNKRDQAAADNLAAAEAALLRTSAPDGPAAMMKLTILFGDETREEHVGIPGWEDDLVHLALEDARRFLTRRLS